MNVEQLENYVHINHSQFEQPTLNALNYYAQRYMLTVPFENIDVQNGVRISVEVEDIFNKVVNHHRGGFCYEMNTLFKAYLLEKGFKPELMSATIHTPGGGRSLPGSHVSLVVPLNDMYYVADVGFGDLPLQVIPITLPDNPQPVEDVTGTFRAIFDSEAKQIYYVQKYENDSWNTKYEAKFEAKTIHDFDYNIEYNQTNPNSTFVKRLLITMPKEYGRATMSQDYLTLTSQQQKEKFDVTKDNYHQFLTKHFGLNVNISRIEQKDA